MTTTASSTRHLKSLWRGKECWHWAALYYGHVQPVGYRNNWRRGRRWQFHITPLHLSRDGGKWEVGLCLGRRTVYVLRHA